MFSLLRSKLIVPVILRHRQACVVNTFLTTAQTHEIRSAKAVQQDDHNRQNFPSYRDKFKHTNGTGTLKSMKNILLYKTNHEGRISKNTLYIYVEKIFSELTTNIDAGEVAFALGLCSDILNSTPQERIEIFHEIWDKFLFIGYDIRHYNAMVDVLGRNKTPLYLKDITDLLGINKLYPTNETFYLLLHGVCLKGDMDEANAIMKVIKSKNIQDALSMSHMIIGNCVAGNLDQAKKIASEATNQNWGRRQMFFGYAESGNIDKVIELLEGDCVIDPASLCEGLVRIVKNFGENAAQPLYEFIPNDEVILRKTIGKLQSIGAYKTIFAVMERMQTNGKTVKCYGACIDYVSKTALDNVEELKYYVKILLAHNNKNNAPFQIFNSLVAQEIHRQKLSDVHYGKLMQKFPRCKSQQFYPSDKCTSTLRSINADFVAQFYNKYNLHSNSKSKLEQHFSAFLNAQDNPEINGLKKYSDVAPLDILRWSGNCEKIEMFYPTYWNDAVSLFSYLMLILAKEDYQHIKKLILEKEKLVKLLTQLELEYVLAERNLDPELDLLLQNSVNVNATFKKFTILLKAKRFDDAKNLLRKETVAISESMLMNFLKTCPDLDAKKELILTLRSDLPNGALLHFINSVVSSNRIDIIEELVPLVESEMYMFTDKEKIIMMDFLLKNGKKCDYAHHYLTEETVQFHSHIHKDDVTMESALEKLGQMNTKSIKVVKFASLDTLLINKSKPEDLKMWVEKIMQLIPGYNLSRLMNKNHVKDFMLQNKFYDLFEDRDYSFIKLLNDTPMNSLNDIVNAQPLNLMPTMKYSLKDEHLQDKLIRLLLLHDNSSNKQLFMACITYNIDISPENAEKMITKMGKRQVKIHLCDTIEKFLQSASIYNVDEGFQSFCNLQSIFGMKDVPHKILNLYAKAYLNGMHQANEETMGTLMNCHKRLISDTRYLEYNGIYPLLIEQCLMKNGGVSMIFNKETDI